MKYVIIILNVNLGTPSCLGVWDSVHQNRAYEFLKSYLKEQDIYDSEYQAEVEACVNIHELAAVAERHSIPVRVFINSLNDEREVWPI